jgi:hypothetical protein
MDKNRIPPRQPPRDERTDRRPPREPQGSSDSFRPVAPGQEGDVFQVVLAVEERLTHKLDQQRAEMRAELGEFDERMKKLEDTMRETSFARLDLKELTTKINELLASDKTQNAELLTIKQQQQAAEAGAAAGTASGNEAGAKAGGKKAAIVAGLLFAWEVFRELWPHIKAALTQ